MKITIKGDWTCDRVEVEIDGFVNCFVYYTEHVDQLVNELEKLMKRSNPEALIESIYV